eukprot:15271977-Heterocapsa_arctica.AAC.1
MNNTEKCLIKHGGNLKQSEKGRPRMENETDHEKHDHQFTKGRNHEMHVSSGFTKGQRWRTRKKVYMNQDKPDKE